MIIAFIEHLALNNQHANTPCSCTGKVAQGRNACFRKLATRIQSPNSKRDGYSSMHL